MIALILAVGLATLISAFCSVSEAVLYSVPWSLVELLKKQGRVSGQILEGLRTNIEQPITAILTLNTVANTAGAAVAGAAFAAVFGPDHLAWFAAGFTVIILVFSEILPKTLGVLFTRSLAPRLARPVRWLVVVLMPVIWAGSWLGRLVRRRHRDPDHTEDDIRAVVSLTRRAGIIRSSEERSIRNILALDTKVVSQIMTPRTVVLSLPADMTVAAARAKEGPWPHSRIPVYGDDTEDIVGVVFRRQVFEALADDRDSLRLADLMKPVHFVLENMSLDKLLAQFLEGRTHLFVVLDEYGGLAGVVTLEDVLEEILGTEIVDETDQVVDMREMARRRRSELVGRGPVGPERAD
ncbi:MAG: hemolysin family protein [Desulfovibrionaceae bacterium]